jgi:peroxiredoxin
MPTTAPRIEPGDVLTERELRDITGAPVRLSAPNRLTHLQFRRFATCPICNLHLRSIVRRHDDILAAGIREVVVFHSSAEELLDYQADLPFTLIGDPDKHLYREFGVEAAARSLLSPRVWLPALWGIIRAGRRLTKVNPHGEVLGLPADFLIAPDNRVIARKYGTHAYDQWTVDELLGHAAA